MQESYAISWDLETVPDLEAVRRLYGMGDASDVDVREALGDGFPKLPLHKIACIGALVGKRTDKGWGIVSLGAPHIGTRSEADLIQSFADRIGELDPQLISFNGHGFDLPVLRYRAMVNRVGASGLHRRNYFNRYSDDSLDLCDVLASYDPRSKTKLDDLSKIMGLSGKPEGVDGSQVETLVNEGRIQEVADYCETDVLNTFRIWLLYEVFRGALTNEELNWSEASLREHVISRSGKTTHLRSTLGME